MKEPCERCGAGGVSLKLERARVAAHAALGDASKALEETFVLPVFLRQMRALPLLSGSGALPQWRRVIDGTIHALRLEDPEKREDMRRLSIAMGALERLREALDDLLNDLLAERWPS